MTNFVFADANTILIADKDDLITINARNGKRIDKFEHDVERAQFVLMNERGQAVVGGRDEIAAFQINGGNPRVNRSVVTSAVYGSAFNIQDFAKSQKLTTKIQKPNEIWRVKHKPPSRGVLRIIGGNRFAGDCALFSLWRSWRLRR